MTETQISVTRDYLPPTPEPSPPTYSTCRVLVATAIIFNCGSGELVIHGDMDFHEGNEIVSCGSGELEISGTASILWNRIISCAASVLEIGGDAEMYATRLLDCGSAELEVSGDALLVHSWRVDCTPSELEISGDASITRNLLFACEAGELEASGDVSLLCSRVVSCDSGELESSGDASIICGRRVDCESGELEASGDVGINRGLLFDATGATLEIEGDCTMTEGGEAPENEVIECGSGELVAGGDASLLCGRRMDCAAGEMEISGTATLTLNIIDILTNNQSTLHTTQFEIAVPAGNSLNLHWGDGEVTAVTCNGLTQTLQHTYSNTGTYTISLGIDYDEINDIRFANQSWLSGNISFAASMPDLVTISCGATGMTGDIRSLASLTSLWYIGLGDTDMVYTTGALPAWNGDFILIQSTGLSASEVDQFLIDFADGCGSNGLLYIGGTNGTRTSASDSAKTTILAAGWTLSVNE